MAIAAVQAPAAVPQQATPPAATASEPTMLQKLTERLDPAQIQYDENSAFVWSAAAKATAIFFSAAALAGFIGTAVLAAHLIVPATIGALALLALTAITCRLFQSVSDIAQKTVDESNEIKTYLDRLRLPSDVQNSLNQKGIQWNAIPGVRNESDLMRLTPLIALHEKIEADFAKNENLSQDKVGEANRITLEIVQDENPNFVALSKKAINFAILRTEATEADAAALSQKIEAGFINALIRRPQYAGTIDQIGVEFGYPCSNNIASYAFVFKNRNLAPITFFELRTNRVAQLGQRFAAAMA
jgi:hypothetical protein